MLRGVVHGRMIELDNEPGLPDGQQVTVVVQPAKPQSANGIRAAFGAWANDADDLDAYLEWNRRQRQIGRQEIES